MPQAQLDRIALAREVWDRYQWLRDNGHLSYVQKAAKCEDFFEGLQWSKEDLALLKSYRRPALTINKIISTVSNVLGEQIFNRTDVAFKPRRNGATEDVANVLTKVFSQISENNQLPWIRSDVFCDGAVTSRGFFDVRLDFSDSLRGEVRVTQLNPKNVLVDSDADEYDPDSWADVVITKWMSVDEIELVYGKKYADQLRSRTDSYFPFGFDSIDNDRDRFGTARAYQYVGQTENDTTSMRRIRVLERQWRKVDNVLHFVDVEIGDMRRVPSEWSDAEVQTHLQNNPNLALTKKLIHRIRWTVVADSLVLHDDWSPYKHFTVVPYFPYFRRGRTVGIVENLLGPQELLNKVSSQELHVVNTSANSGWKLKRNALQNMTVPELEARGAQTGLVLELDEIDNAEKITPNAVPTGLDRLSFKAEEHIKSISGVSDYMSGFAREDVAAKSVVANQRSGQSNLAKIMDNLNRTDFILARNVLDLVQEYYTEERLLFITTDEMRNASEELKINEMTPEGQVVNDLTLGEYAVTVTSQPQREMFEETQFEQVARMRTELGVNIPDSRIIEASRLQKKAEILKEMQESTQTPEAQQAQQLKMRATEADVAAKEAEAQNKQSEARLKAAKTEKETLLAQKEAQTLANGGELPQVRDADLARVEAQMQVDLKRLDNEHAIARERLDQEIALKREQMLAELELDRERAQQDARIKSETARAEAVRKNREAQTPLPTSTEQ